MNKNLLMSVCAGAFAVTSFAADALRPNILIIFTDDQGYADLACYGNTKNKTPRMDRLAEEGTRFTSFYSQTVCGPSRSALLTGRYPQLSKGWSMPAHEVTWAEQIGKVGYQTACIGKWDVSNRKPILDRMPIAQGFDYYFGPLGANDGGTVKFHENNRPAGKSSDMGGLTRMYTDKSIDYLENRRDKSKPFVLYLAHTMMHTIIDASPKFRGKSKGDLYGDVVEEFDFETGRLLDKLDELGLRDNTLVIYTTDNGPWNQPRYYERKKGHPKDSIFWGESGPLRNGKGSCREGGYRAPCIVRWPGKVPAGKVSDTMWATIDFMPTFANLAGFKLPDDRIIDGIDQTDVLFGKTDKGRESFFFNNAGIRMGKWKYLLPNAHFHGYAVEADRKKVDELFDLDADIGETTNLADKYPEVLQRLKEATEKIKNRKDTLLPPPGTAATAQAAGPKLKDRIELKKGDSFSFERSPDIVGKDLIISATITSETADGVIVAQGGTLVGYSLYLRGGKVIFGVRVESKLKELACSEVVTGKSAKVEAKLGKDGTRSLTVNGKALTTTGPALKPQPKMGLSAGEDQNHNVGNYRKEQFKGSIKNLVLEIR
jgi:arylsulfatase A-like enzyme